MDISQQLYNAEQKNLFIEDTLSQQENQSNVMKSRRERGLLSFCVGYQVSNTSTTKTFVRLRLAAKK